MFTQNSLVSHRIYNSTWSVYHRVYTIDTDMYDTTLTYLKLSYTKLCNVPLSIFFVCVAYDVLYKLGVCIKDGYPYRVLGSFYSSILERYRAVPPPPAQAG